MHLRTENESDKMPISIYGENNPALRPFMPDRNATVWRYMDIGKYLDLITRRELWFTRVSELQKIDPYEGSLTKYDIDKTNNILAAKSMEELKTTLLRYNEAGILNMMNNVPDKSHHWFQLLYLIRIPMVGHNPYMHSVSCWHSNMDESDAMWELYAKRETGIAIKSTVDRFLRAFESSKRNIFIAKVLYDSENRLSALTCGTFDSFLIKRHAFCHENELRLIALTSDGYETPEWTEDNQTYRIDPHKSVPEGYYISCDIDSLIEEIVISPLMTSYASQALEVISKHFLSNIPIRKSTLLTKEDIPLIGSPELTVMWNEFVKTKRIIDINEIKAKESETADIALSHSSETPAAV
jgi:hypothetical protein